MMEAVAAAGRATGHVRVRHLHTPATTTTSHHSLQLWLPLQPQTTKPYRGHITLYTAHSQGSSMPVKFLILPARAAL